MKHKAIVVDLEYDGEVDTYGLINWLESALDSFVGQNPTIEYVDHDVYEEPEG
jgi:hypothetical protein